LNRHIIANTIIHHLYAIDSPQTGYFSIRSWQLSKAFKKKGWDDSFKILDSTRLNSLVHRVSHFPLAYIRLDQVTIIATSTFKEHLNDYVSM
jgi:pterin-4a-carbinolamine dehydratase